MGQIIALLLPLLKSRGPTTISILSLFSREYGIRDVFFGGGGTNSLRVRYSRNLLLMFIGFFLGWNRSEVETGEKKPFYRGGKKASQFIKKIRLLIGFIAHWPHLVGPSIQYGVCIAD